MIVENLPSLPIFWGEEDGFLKNQDNMLRTLFKTGPKKAQKTLKKSSVSAESDGFDSMIHKNPRKKRELNPLNITL